MGSLKKAPVTNRKTNPLNPHYELLGAKELDNYDMYNENVSLNAKPATAPVKTRAEMKKQIEKIPNLDKEEYKKNLGQFYQTEPYFMQEVDFKKIAQNCKPPAIPKPKVTRPTVQQLQENAQLKRNTKLFHQAPLSENSEKNYAQSKFYADTNPKSERDMSTKEAIERFKNINDPHRKTTTALLAEDDSQHFKRDLANFYGEPYKPSDHGSVKGSIFQNNAAEFYGIDKPEPGERPFKIDENNMEDPSKNKPVTSVLNERKLKQHEMNMQRNPNFIKNNRRFYGLKSYGMNFFILI